MNSFNDLLNKFIQSGELEEQGVNESIFSFPLEVFPQAIQDIIIQTNKCLNFPIDFIATSMLFTVSVVIGNTHRVELTKGWQESAVLFIIIVSPPGTNKSHPLSFAIRPLIKHDEKTYRKFIEELGDYEKTEKLTKKNRESAGLSDSTKPIWKKYLVSDFTVEALCEVHKNNPNGIGVYTDEAAGWVKNFNRYNNGSEMEFWLSVWSGKPINIDRKSGIPVFVNNPSISVCGTIQNGILEQFAKGGKSRNGFLDRILFVMPEGLKKQYWSTVELSDSVSETWNEIVLKLINIPESRDELDNPIPKVLKFTPEAQHLLSNWQKKNTDEINSLAEEEMQGLLSKLEIYVIRLSLIMEMFRCACCQSHGDIICEESVQGSIKLVEYFKNSAIRAHSFMHEINPYQKLHETAKMFYDSLQDQFSSSDAIKIADKLAIPPRTYYEMLKKRGLFKKIRKGFYEKLI